MSARVPLLDRGTQLAHSYGVTVWPSCGEATITYRGSGKGSTDPVVDLDEPDPSENLRRSLRRSRTSIRRYCLHNGLRHMPTLTYGHEPPSTLSGLTNDLRAFRQKLLRRGLLDGPFPYVWVPERGKEGNRLHVHMAVGWWERIGAVEVCERCIRPKLRAKREAAGQPIPEASAACIGCAWGHGFVGAPSEGNGDPRALASYVSKYVSKELACEGQQAGSQRYRVAEGFQPTPVRFDAATLSTAITSAASQLGDELALRLRITALHELVDGWEGPPVWTLEPAREQETA